MDQPISTHQVCPKCGANGAFTWFEKGRGFCHSGCNNVFTEDFVDVKKQEPSGFTYEGIRSLDPEIAKKYGIVLHTDEHGKPYRYAFKYPHTVKYRDFNDKSNSWIKDIGVGMREFFGPKVNPASSKRIYITEGEFDAASLYQAMGSTWPVLSLPSGSIGDEFVKKQYDYLNSFQEIVYAGELDKTGKKAADRFYKAFSSKFYYIPLTKWKDANEALQKGDESELKWTALRPQRWSPENFFCSDDKVIKVLREENPYEYVPTKHSGLNSVIRGLVKGGLTFVLAPPGSGKTELFRYFETGLLEVDDVKVGILHMEEQKSTTYRGMASYELGKNVRTKEDTITNHLTELEVEEAALRATKGDRTIVFEMQSGDDPMEVKEYCRIAAGVYGAHYIFIDHVQRLAYLQGIDGATSVLTKLAANLAQLSKELNVGIILISHVNEDGHTKYAKSLEEEAIICIRLERDKEATDVQTRNTTKFHVTKNRPFSKLGYAGAIFYDEETTILKEIEIE